jgi:peptide chain release factor subunit 1
MCDSRFHVEALEELLENDSKWGFIIMCVRTRPR